ncbi:hydroxymethylglutaryl-CoA lyase [Oceanicola sp. S124]|uniref:hydroxymethylglutaryl-CoA lyase n=1 Tax=Oceanicola sp. S124 TaxID=1042378 RepID=UPI0002557D6F|nr:hydroxymethylglutaryl-CoA lyase [Oceanicola sp. S124]
MSAAPRDAVTIYEVGPRDGLQNEARQVPAAQKIALVDLLSAAGLPKIEVTSFVSPKWVPQLADASEVMAGITRRDGTGYAVLVPNEKGLARAIEARPTEIAVFASASEGFSRRNINCSVAESLARFAPVFAGARKAGLPVRAYVSCVTDCPYDGPVAPDAVAGVAARLSEMGAFGISLGETLGRATPDRVADMLKAVTARVPAAQLAGHFHDTDGHALANIEVSLAAGLRVFDSSIGGLGGCPYAPGARGNVATEAVVDLLQAAGFALPLDREALRAARALVADLSRAA